MELAPVLTGCHVCRDPRVKTINGWMKAGVSDLEISRRLKQGGDGYSRITLGKHKRFHLMSDFDRERKAAAKAMEKQQKTLKGPKTGDLLRLVADNVYARVIEGTLEPSLAEGLRAQEGLDRRAEKGADREVLMQMAQILGGALPVGFIEGEYRVVDEEAEADYAELRLLGAGT
jgi:hypothetical protein